MTRHVLIVEDGVVVARAMARVLSAQGWSCAHAPSVPAALAYINPAAKPFHAAIVDLDLGEGGRGETVLERLAALRPPVAAIVVSGVARPEEASSIALRFGVPLLEKPVTAAILCASLNLEVKLTTAISARGLAGLHARTQRDLLRRVVYAMREADGNQSAAAAALSIPRTTLRETLELYELDPR